MSRLKSPAPFNESQILEAVTYFPNWHRFRRLPHLKDMARQIIKDNQIDRYFPGERRTSSDYDLEGLRRFAQTFERVIDLITDYPAVYAYIASNGLQDVLFSGMQRRRRKDHQSKLDEAVRIARDYPSMVTFAKDHPSLLGVLRRGRLIDDVFPPEKRGIHRRSSEIYTVKNLRRLVERYPSLTIFQQEERRAYEYIKFHGLQGEVYPDGFIVRARLTDDDLVVAILRLEAMTSPQDLVDALPDLAHYLTFREVHLESMIGQPFFIALELLNSLRGRNKIIITSERLKRIQRSHGLDEQEISRLSGSLAASPAASARESVAGRDEDQTTDLDEDHRAATTLPTNQG
jgi:hypothetical protein